MVNFIHDLRRKEVKFCHYTLVRRRYGVGAGAASCTRALMLLTDFNSHKFYFYQFFVGPEGGLHFSLKQWNPDLYDEFVFNIYSIDKCQSWSLTIGANQNEKLILHYQDFCLKKRKMLMQKTLPHMIPIGRWNDLWLKMLKGEIKLGYENKIYPIFGWKTDQSEFIFEPMFMSYEAVKGNVLGIYFRDEQCHVENVSTLLLSNIYPVKIRQELSFHFRGTGSTVVCLMTFPG